MTAVAGHEAYAHARELLAELKLPIMTLAGNHDDPEVMQHYFPDRWGSSRDGVHVSRCFGVDLIGIDLRTGPEPTGYATADCLRALDQALAKSSQALLFSHYPLFGLDNSRIDDELSTLNRREVHETIAPYRSKIHAAFHGHLHLWISACASGLPRMEYPLHRSYLY
jgi:3',5'-cyclic AMP phosphodiesterase CpdA